MCQLGQEDEPAAEDDEEDSMETESGPPTTTMKSFKDAIVALEDIQNFLEGSFTHIHWPSSGCCCSTTDCISKAMTLNGTIEVYYI